MGTIVVETIIARPPEVVRFLLPLIDRFARKDLGAEFANLKKVL
jgi:hypothetical protein